MSNNHSVDDGRLTGQKELLKRNEGTNKTRESYRNQNDCVKWKLIKDR